MAPIRMQTPMPRMARPGHGDLRCVHRGQHKPIDRHLGCNRRRSPRRRRRRDWSRFNDDPAEGPARPTGKADAPANGRPGRGRLHSIRSPRRQRLTGMAVVRTPIRRPRWHRPAILQPQQPPHPQWPDDCPGGLIAHRRRCRGEAPRPVHQRLDDRRQGVGQGWDKTTGSKRTASPDASGGDARDGGNTGSGDAAPANKTPVRED